MDIGGLGVMFYFLGKKNSLRSDTFFLAEIKHHPQTAVESLQFVGLKTKSFSNCLLSTQSRGWHGDVDDSGSGGRGSENVERQGWRDRALQGRIYGRFSEPLPPLPLS
ncbi:MAG: hypothetical protein R3198_16200, partial [Marinobacter sp.]|nr:hypothetical protein [Marinobacter sp.]